MTSKLSFSLPEALTAVRLDKALTELISKQATQGQHFSRAKIQRLIEAGLVSINGQVVKKASYEVLNGSLIEVSLDEPIQESLSADYSVKFTVLYEDEDVLVVDKPAGLAVHPGAGSRTGTLAHGLVAYLGEDIKRIGDALRPGLVHRLDKDTSGVMVVAKTEVALAALKAQFLPPRTIARTYLALTVNLPKKKAGSTLLSPVSGRIETQIMRHPNKRKTMHVVFQGGKIAITHWKLLTELKRGYLLELQLETGRTHQIRAQLKYAGAAIFGDKIYGPQSSDLTAAKRISLEKCLQRQALHAARLCFIHPSNKEAVSFESPLPLDFRSAITVLAEY